MFDKLLSKLFGNKQKRDMKRLLPVIDEINAYYEEYQSLSDEELSAKTAEFRARLAEGETLDDLLPEAFAVVKDACRRNLGRKWVAAGNEITWDMVPFDVQLAGGVSLHEGKIAEMATGEGKTLVAILPLYLNALAGQGAHLVTVNDYLARRDSEWMGHIFEFLGLTVGCLDKTEPNTAERRAQYYCDITYGTNHEYGFDYLRDNMVQDASQMVQQRGHFYAIVDEVDNILIDEARTPLIISGPVERSTQRYNDVKPLVFDLVRKQNDLVNRIVNEAEEAIRAAGDGDIPRDAAILLLAAQKGLPKHKKLLKIKAESGVQTAIERIELEFMAEKKMFEIDEQLFYVVDEKGHQIDLTEKGRMELSPANPKLWELPDIVDEVAAAESGDFEVLELVDGRRVLVSGRAEERAAMRGEDGWIIQRHDGILKLPNDQVATVIPGKEISKPELEMVKEILRVEHGHQTEKLHSISQLLKAYTLYERDVEYVVQENKVIIVDEFTGRMMHGRRWSDGLHQAVEAKEGVKVESETQTLATITLQNYFRMYKKLSGMTGTAETEASEFTHTYKMDVVVVPTNRPCIRDDQDDKIYKTKREKYNAIIEEIGNLHKEGLPVLVGTVSVEVSELISRMLTRLRIPHNVLNAKNHQHEADIVRFAGQTGGVTIATNMAGRGTDIKLHPDVIREVDGVMTGGLQVIGTERHEARRIDRQLRGRSGRQGDPGRSIFFLSLEDDLMRLFGSERIAKIMDRLGLQEGEEITHPWVTKAIESAQKKVEQRNFEIRKRTLDYDNVMNKQREAIYGLRKEVLTSADLRETVLGIHFDALRNLVGKYGDVTKRSETWDLKGLLEQVQRLIPYADFISNEPELQGRDLDGFVSELMRIVEEAYDRKRQQLNDDDLLLRLARYVVLTRIDSNWMDHLLGIDDLRESIGWRGYAQLDPLHEYQREASIMFEDMMYNIHNEVLEHFFLMQPAVQPMEPEVVIHQAEARQATLEESLPVRQAPEPGMSEEEMEQVAAGEGRAPRPQAVPFRAAPKVGRNDPCPCGSGRKYKKCCGANAGA